MDDKEPTQQTQPKKGERITIPVPTRDEKRKKKLPKDQRTVDQAARERARQRSGEGD